MSTETTPARQWGVRSIAALLIFIIAAVLTPIALVGHWGHRTVVDSERYIDTVGPLIDSPEVQEGLSTAITDAVIAKVDTTSQVEGLLQRPVPQAALQCPACRADRRRHQQPHRRADQPFRRIRRLRGRVDRPQHRCSAWLMAALENRQEGPVQIQGDELVLDISAALAKVQQFLVDNGVTAAASITLPDNDRQIVLLNSPALGQVRFIYALTSPILQWIPLLVAALFALSIALSRRRARIVVASGIYFVVIAGLLTLALNAGEEAFNNQLEGTPFGPASEVFWTTLLSYLILGVQAVFVLGICVIIAGWFGGRTSLAKLLRRHLVTGLDELGDRVTGMLAFRTFVAAHKVSIRWGVYIVVGPAPPRIRRHVTDVGPVVRCTRGRTGDTGSVALQYLGRTRTCDRVCVDELDRLRLGVDDERVVPGRRRIL